MGQSIAILIGNTRYRELGELTCCANDVAKMHDLLAATQKFNQIVEFIDQSVSNVEDGLRKLADQENDLDEVFFYFTGHGFSNSNDFYMCFGGFNANSPNTTCLSRTDAYDFVRKFNAELSVFVVDACEAGRNLIKSEFRPSVVELKTSFSNFVQFSSSTDTQSSFAGEEISLFTEKFIRACLLKEEGIIYYLDVENALRDEFLHQEGQTPHFIRQGTSQEMFCNDANRLDDLRSIFFNKSEKEQGVDATPLAACERARIAIDRIEEKIPTAERAQEFINAVFETTLASSIHTPEVVDFFDTRTVKYDEYERVQNKRTVIGLLERRGGSDSFVESDIERKRKRQPFASLTALAALGTFGMPDEYDETYNLFNLCGLKGVHVGIYFEPKFMALNRVFSEIVFLPRLTECLILTCNSKERRSGWSSFNEYEGTKKWEWSHHAWSDDPVEVSEKYVSDPYEYTKEYIYSFNAGEA